MKKVIFFVGSLEAGGLERFVNKVSILGKRKNIFEPIVICLSSRSGIFLKQLEMENIQVFEAPKGWQRSVGALIRLGKLVRNQKAAIVHSQVNFSLLQQWIVTSLFSRARFMVTERNCYPLKGWDLVRRRFQFYFLRLMGVHYSGNSQEVVKHLARLMRYSEEKIPLIPNGMDIPVIDPDIRLRIRENHYWQPGDFVIGYVGRFAVHKGQQYFLSVMEELHHSLGDRLKICFIGDGSKRAEIESLSRNSRIAHLVTFLGIVDNVPDYYQAFDCTALLSEYEGMPNVVLEAMAYGLPVIANPVGNVAELFGQDRGILNSSKIPKQTASLFLRLAEDKSECERIGSRAKDFIKASYSVEQTLNLLSQFYARGK